MKDNRSKADKNPKKAELSKKRSEIFDSVIRSLSTALKNSTLYSPQHPVFNFSLKNLKESLNEWFAEEDSLDLGISHDNLLLKSLYVKESEDLYKEVAEHLHSKGIIAISFMKGIELKELVEFFTFMKNDAQTIRQKGGILKNLPPAPHLAIKEIDYSDLLGSAKERVTAEEKEIQESLYTIAEEAKKGKLPESKLEFLADFLSDPRKSASVLNKLYRDAVAKLEGDSALENIRDTIARIYEYFDKETTKDSQELRANLTQVIAKLDPSLVIRLFEQAQIDGKNFDLAQEITGNFSDDFIADFIESMITGEEVLNENLLKVFDRLAPSGDKTENVVPMIVDKMMEKGLLSMDTLSQLQESIKEIFKAHPQSKFMSEMYKMTVDTFIDKKTGITAAAAKLTPLIRKFRQFLDEESQKKEKVRLLIDVIWLEDNPVEFKKLNEQLLGLFPAILGLKDIGIIKEIVDLFTEKLRPEQKDNKEMSQEARKTLERIKDKKTISQIISFIPDLDSECLPEIVHVGSKLKGVFVPLLVEAFISEDKELRRSKIASIIAAFKEDARDEILKQMEYCEGITLISLFKILKKIDPASTRKMATRLLRDKDIKLRLEILEEFDPESDEERDMIFNVFKNDKNEEIQNKALSVLVGTGEQTIIDKLFRYIEKSLTKRRFFLRLIELCGERKAKASLPHLKKTFLRRPFFNTKQVDELRVAAAVSLRQLDLPEAWELIEKGLEDKSEAVKRMCSIILELKKTDKSPEVKRGGDQHAR